MNKKTVFLLILLLSPMLTLFFNLPMATATTDTFTGETIDGTGQYIRITYPPDPDGSGSMGTTGQWTRVGQMLFESYYYAYRAYVSFDTSSLPHDAEISNAELRLKTLEDQSATDFIVQIYGDTQPIWGDSLTISDWGSGDVLCDTWNTTNYVDEVYINFTIPVEQINKDGRTQFEVMSDRELNNIEPSGLEFLYFHSSEASGNEPQLVITYTVTEPTGSMKQTIGENWLFAGEWHDFVSTYTYGGTFDVVRFAFSDLYDSYGLDFEFGDSDYVEVPDDSSLNVTSTVSVLSWIKPESFPSLYMNIVSKGDTLNPYSLYISNDTGTYNLRFIITNSSGTYINPKEDITDKLGEWMHVAGTYDGTYTKLYLDGELVDVSSAVSGLLKLNDNPLYIGADDENDDGNADSFFDGVIDHVQIFNRTLSQSEIEYNMNHFEPKDRLNLVGLWRMDEGTGTTVWDASVEQNTGTNNGATYTDGMILIDDHWVITEYDVTNDEWSLISGDAIANIQTGTTEQIGNDFIVTYPIFFKTSILDRLDCDVYIYSVNTTGTIDPWDEIATDYFNIYNLGGFVVMESQNTAGRIEGGDVFDLYADGANAWVRVNQTYRKIQHVKVQAGFVIKDPNDYGDTFVRYGIDFVDPTTQQFIRGWNVLINVTAIDVTNAAYCVLEVRWYYNDVQVGTTDTMYSMWEDQAFMTPDGEYSGTRFHLDLWFNKVNGSSVIGGRVSPFMYGLTKDDPPWWLWWNWWGAGEWKPMRVNTTDSFLFTNLLDYTGETITSKALDLTRFWCNLTNVGANDDIYVMNYRTFDFSFATGDMEGINTPAFPETLDPELPAGGGILAGLFTQIRKLAGSIADAVTTGALRVWSIFVSFLDTIAEWMGVPGAFSNFITWIENGWNYLVNSLTYLFDMLTHTFTMIGEGLSSIVQTMAHIANYWVQMFQTFKSFLQGGWGTGTNIFNDYIRPVIPLLIICYPLVLFFMWADKGTQALFNHLKMLMDVAGFLIHLFISIAQLVITTIMGLIDAIPIV